MALANKTFQDLITFTRSTSGSYVGSDGNLVTSSPVANYMPYSSQPENAAWTKQGSFVQTNLITNSQTFNTGWGPNNIQAFGSGSIANAIVAPDGTLTADLISNAAAPGVDFHYVAQGITLSQNTTYTLSVYAKAGPVGSGIIWLLGNAAFDIFCYFNLNTGTVGTTTNFILASIQNVGGGWYRCVASFTNTAVTGAQSIGFGLAQVDGTPSWNSVGLAGTQQAYLWGAQLVQGSAPGDYQVTVATTLPVLYPDYNGALRARKLCETTADSRHAIYQNSALTLQSAPFSASVYLKSDSRTRALVGVGNSRFTSCIVNLSTGVAGPFSGAEAGSVSVASFNVGNGWWRIVITGTFSASDLGYVWVGVSNGNEFYTGDGSSGIFVADIQLVSGTSAGPYYETTTTLSYVPRFDYDPVTRAAKGLLMEPSRTNLLLQSSDFQTTWAKTNIAVTANTVTAPDGTMAGDTITATSVGSNIGFVSQVFTAAGSTNYALSVYVKHGTESAVVLQQVCSVSGVSSGCYATYNVVAGTTSGLTNYGGITGATANITNAGNGWYRCTLIIPIPAGVITGGSIWLYPYAGADPAGTYAYMWGAQLEVGSFASSYIPTGISQVTRAIDVFDGKLFSTWYNQPEGTIFVDGIVAAQNGVTNTTITVGAVQNNNVSRDARFLVGATIVAFNVLGATDAIYPYKMSGAYKLNDSATSLNGAAATVNTTTVVGVGSALQVFPNANYMHVRRITYYPSRLTNAQLQSITT